MFTLLETAGIYAAIIVAAVEAIRKQVPALDGWRVLLVAAIASLVLSALFMTSATADALLDAARISVLAWVIAVGGNAWVSRLAGKVGGTAEGVPDGITNSNAKGNAEAEA